MKNNSITKPSSFSLQKIKRQIEDAGYFFADVKNNSIILRRDYKVGKRLTQFTVTLSKGENGLLNLKSDYSRR